MATYLTSKHMLQLQYMAICPNANHLPSPSSSDTWRPWDMSSSEGCSAVKGLHVMVCLCGFSPGPSPTVQRLIYLSCCILITKKKNDSPDQVTFRVQFCCSHAHRRSLWQRTGVNMESPIMQRAAMQCMFWKLHLCDLSGQGLTFSPRTHHAMTTLVAHKLSTFRPSTELHTQGTSHSRFWKCSDPVVLSLEFLPCLLMLILFLIAHQLREVTVPLFYPPPPDRCHWNYIINVIHFSCQQPPCSAFESVLLWTWVGTDTWSFVYSSWQSLNTLYIL